MAEDSPTHRSFAGFRSPSRPFFRVRDTVETPPGSMLELTAVADDEGADGLPAEVGEVLVPADVKLRSTLWRAQWMRNGIGPTAALVGLFVVTVLGVRVFQPPRHPSASAPPPPVRPLAQATAAGVPFELAPNPPPVSTGIGGGGLARSAPALWRRFGSSPAEAAVQLVRANLTRPEKLALLQGFGWVGYNNLPGHFVGNIAGVARLGIPSTNIQDAGQGFRTTSDVHVGQVTAFPSALAAAATWDTALVGAWARAIGIEFRKKGANVVLGPAVNVHRIPRNGRNGEYLSGEDANLGAPLAAAYVRAVQAVGVAACAKHFVLNSQETDRNTMSADASDRTLFEAYYPPFEAAVKAGVASVMCGYNRLNGTYVCGGAGPGGGERCLVEHLRQRMGFEGFVMTDWWALHDVRVSVRGVVERAPLRPRPFARAPSPAPAPNVPPLTPPSAPALRSALP